MQIDSAQDRAPGRGAALVSVVIPTYNRADFIVQSVESALTQDYRPLEVIVVDDGSTDETAEILRPYAESERILYCRQSNQGQAAARNRGIELSRGEFVCFLDSDNRWLPGKVSKSIAVFETRSDVDVVYGDIVLIDQRGRETSRSNMRRNSGKITRYLLRDNFVSMNTTMARRRCLVEIGGFDQGVRIGDDYDLWLRLSTRCSFFYLPEFLAEYRVMDDQLSSNKERRFVSNETVLRSFEMRFPHAVSRWQFLEGRSHFLTRRGRYYASAGSRWKACRLYCRAVGAWPFHIAPWRAIAACLLAGR